MYFCTVHFWCKKNFIHSQTLTDDQAKPLLAIERYYWRKWAIIKSVISLLINFKNYCKCKVTINGDKSADTHKESLTVQAHCQ